MLLSLVALIAVQPGSQSYPPVGQNYPILDPIDGFGVDGVPIELSFAGNKTHIRVGTKNGQYGVWDIRAKRFVKVWYVGREIRQYLPSSPRRVFTRHADGSVALRDEETGEVVRELHIGDEGKYGKREVYSLLPGPDGGCFVVIGDSRDPANPHMEYVYVTSEGRVKSTTLVVPPALDFSVTPTLVAILEGEKTIAFYNPMTGKRLRTLRVHSELPLGRMTFSSDQKLIAVIPYERPVYIISAQTGKEVTRINEWYKVWQTLFSNNGKLLLVVSDSSASLYRVKDGKKVAALLCYSPWGVACFSPDDTLVAIGVKKKIWPLCLHFQNFTVRSKETQVRLKNP